MWFAVCAWSLQTAGVVFSISNAILGLTLLAWANSIGGLRSAHIQPPVHIVAAATFILTKKELSLVPAQTFFSLRVLIFGTVCLIQ